MAYMVPDSTIYAQPENVHSIEDQRLRFKRNRWGKLVSKKDYS
jgi:hypothetical protein